MWWDDIVTSTTSSNVKTPAGLWWLAGFLFLVIVPGSIIGVLTAPGEWYQSLDKLPINPPNWIFAPVWLVLYVLMAIAGWRTFMRDRGSMQMKLWVGQQALNWLWSPMFFTLQLLWPAGVIIITIAALIIAFILTSWKVDRWAALCFVPYLAWVSFASLLNISIAVLN